MNFTDKKYLYFYTKDYTGMYTTTGYTLPITPFTFIPVFDSGDGDFISNTNLLWDFGDGTTSRELTAVHSYNVPGTYNVTCFMYSTGGQGYESSFAQSIIVKDYISDTLAISAQPVNIIETSHYSNPFVLYRFNSWQTFDTLSAQGLTIQLYASGSGAPLLDSAVYNTDKYAHLKPYCRFLAFEYDSVTNAYELVPVNEIATQNNDVIYVKLDDTLNIVRCLSSDVDATVAGTSGSRIVYFTDDISKIPSNDDTKLPQPVITLAYFNTTSLKDIETFGKNYTPSEYPLYHQIVSNWFIPTFVQQKNITHLSITSNGIDTEGINVNTSFEIQPTKFINQKIPVVVKAKDSQNYTAKSAPVLHLNTVDPDSISWVHLDLVDSNNNIISAGVTFHEDFGPLSAQTFGGFFKGYLTSTESYENVRIHATGQLSGTDYYIIPTNFGIIAHPQSSNLHRIDITQSIDAMSVTLTDTQFSTPGLSGIYDTCIVPNQDGSGNIRYYMWVADADTDYVLKYDEFGTMVLSASLPSNSAPAGIAGDSNGDVWVTLYDAVSTVKVDQYTGDILAVAVPTTPNQDWSSSSLYTLLSGFGGGNSIQPTGVDVDSNNTLYVAYSHPLSSFICKYNSSGILLSTFNAPGAAGLWSPSEILVDTSNTLWAIYKYHITGVGQDFLRAYFVDGTTQDWNLSGADLWDMTTDVSQNIWITANKNQLVKFGTTSYSSTLVTISASPAIGEICNFTGISCTTDGTILVVDAVYNKIHSFKNVVGNNITNIDAFSLSVPSDITGNLKSNLNAFGDWTGFKYINKFFHNLGVVEGLEAYSSVFNIYPVDGKYKIAKINENFDATAQLKTNIFQEPLLDDTRLFDDFIGSAIGNITSDPDTIGKRIYEKIANFSDNIGSIDVCNISALESMYESTGNEFFKQHSYNFSSPANLGRLIDLFSIKFSKLKGYRNQFAENFDRKGTTPQYLLTNGLSATTKFGMNLGVELDINSTAMVVGSAGRSIVAYERFGNIFTKINSYIDNNAVIANSYVDSNSATVVPLSSYDNTWNWGIVLPDNYEVGTLDRYYTFYEYVPGVDNTQVGGIINWSDSLTTITESVSSLDQWNTIMENMLTHTLVEGTGLIST